MIVLLYLQKIYHIDIIATALNPAVDPVLDANNPVVDKAMDTVLQWIEFVNDATRDRFRTEGIGTTFLDDLKVMKEKGICNLAESYGIRTASDGCFTFRLRRICYLIGLIHWVQQDFHRIGQMPMLDAFKDNADSFRAALDVAFNCAEVRRIEKEQLLDTVSKAAVPGEFKDEKKWPERESAFCN